jgi:hypothetical protein
MERFGNPCLDQGVIVRVTDVVGLVAIFVEGRFSFGVIGDVGVATAGASLSRVALEVRGSKVRVIDAGLVEAWVLGIFRPEIVVSFGHGYASGFIGVG